MVEKEKIITDSTTDDYTVTEPFEDGEDESNDDELPVQEETQEDLEGESDLTDDEGIVEDSENKAFEKDDFESTISQLFAN